MMALQVTWFVLIGVLIAGYAILAGFDLGVGFWHLVTNKSEERRAFLRAIAPVWDGNEVWLLTAGGALFAAFPPVYAAVFSGFYLAMLLVLLGLIVRVVAIEFRNQLEETGWRQTWDWAFSLGSVLPTVLFGVALGNVVRGLELDASGNYVGGFFALLNPYALLVGLTGLAMFCTHGALFLAVKTRGELRDKARGWASKAWTAYFALFLVCSAWSLAAFQRGTLVFSLTASLLALLAMIGIWVFNRADSPGRAFLASSVCIAAQLGAVGSTLFPNMLPASNDAALSLTVYNASSSQNTLTVMAILALAGMPIVIGYTIFIYRKFAGPVGVEEAEAGY